MTAQEIREAAYKLLTERGPMKAKDIARELGLLDGHAVTMPLQWDRSREKPLGLRSEGGKWYADQVSDHASE